MSARSCWCILPLVAALATAVVRAESPEGEPSTSPPPPVVAGFADGGIAWIFSDELDLVGIMSAYVPFAPASDPRPYLAVDARTAIERAVSGLTFDVRSLDYRFDVGARKSLRSSDLSFFVGQRGLERVDADGEPWVRYVGVGLASSTQGSPPRFVGPGPFAWSVEAGAIIENREVEADWILRGSARLQFPSCHLAGDLDVDGLVGRDGFDADIAVGPRLYVDRAPASFYLHYVRSRNPLGIGASGVEAGFDFAGAASRTDQEPPVRVGGLLAAGAGDARRAGRFDLRFATPAVAGPFWAAAEVDANVLTAEDTGELYYFLHLGLERPFGGWLGGVYYYHRSNHALAEPNDTVTSFDVLEGGVETPGWTHEREGGERRIVELRARLGYVVDTSFDEDRRWHVRCGARLSIPTPWVALAPFVTLEAETGDVERRSYALGVAASSNVDVEVEYRSDEAYFGRDQTAVVFMTALRF